MTKRGREDDNACHPGQAERSAAEDPGSSNIDTRFKRSL